MSTKKIVKKTIEKNSTPEISVRNTSVNATMLKPIREFWEQLSWSDISEQFGGRTTTRGRSYGEGRNVKSFWATEDGKTIVAVVSGGRDYTTQVTLDSNQTTSRFRMVSRCSCPVGYGCKHGVAAITRFLDYLAKETPIPVCVQVNDKTWETYAPNGKMSVLKINNDDFDEDDWEEDEDDWNDNDGNEDESEEEDEDSNESFSSPLHQPQQSTDSSPTKKDNKSGLSLDEKLLKRSKEDLVALILQFHDDYDGVREHFAQEAFAESVAKTNNIDKLVQKAIKLIDKGIDVDVFPRYDRYDRYSDAPSLDLDSVEEIVKQFQRFDDPLPGLDRIARHLIERGSEYMDNSQEEDSSEIDSVLLIMAEVLIASKAVPVKTILWAHDIGGIGEYSFFK